MQKIKCACGHEGDKDYTKASVLSGESDFYQWRCSDCGQVYWELIKDPIIIKNEPTL